MLAPPIPGATYHREVAGRVADHIRVGLQVVDASQEAADRGAGVDAREEVPVDVCPEVANVAAAKHAVQHSVAGVGVPVQGAGVLGGEDEPGRLVVLTACM